MVMMDKKYRDSALPSPLFIVSYLCYFDLALILLLFYTCLALQ